MTLVINYCRGDKKRRKKIDGFRKKLKIPQSEISESSQYDVKSKVCNIFVNEKNT